jgi:flagellar protein FliL
MQKPMIENKEVEEKKSKSGIKWMVIAAITLFLAGGGAFGAFYYKSVMNSAEDGAEPEMTDSRHSRVKSVIVLDPFLVNLADPYDARFVKTTFYLGLPESSKGAESSTATIAAIRDAIISLLSSKMADEILTTEGKETLREEIRLKVNQVATSLQVVEVYIVDFVIQL